jgi:hypothetical protein
MGSVLLMQSARQPDWHEKVSILSICFAGSLASGCTVTWNLLGGTLGVIAIPFIGHSSSILGNLVLVLISNRD